MKADKGQEGKVGDVTSLRSSQGNHTPGPWEAIPHRSGTQIRADGLIVCSGMSEANARRIVACVNACEGMLTENLEGTSMDQIYRSLREERDELEISNRYHAEDSLKHLQRAEKAEAALAKVAARP